MTEAMPAIAVKNLWFSYEVSENISSTAKTPDKPEARTLDGGCSIDAPRAQYQLGTQAAYKLQLKDVSMALPAGARCALIGANGAGKTTLMSCIGGRHLVEEQAVRVLGQPAFHDTTLANRIALLTGTWTQTVAFVGHNVPYAALEVSTLIKSHSVGIDPARVARLISLLEVNEKWNLTSVSDGQRRRVQILCKMLRPNDVLLLDEITTDLDLLARQDLLQFLREESEQRGVCTIYCTHIFDGLDGWPTHIACVHKGELIFCKPIEEAGDFLAVNAAGRERGWGALFCAVQRLQLEQMPRFHDLLSASPAAATTDVPMPDAAGPAVTVRDLTWSYRPGGAPTLRNLSFELERGVRCLLIGANGAGKTTLLRLLGGKHMVPYGSCKVLGLNAFHDTELNTMLALLSGDWVRQVACVGNGVPFQADFSVEFMANSFCEMLISNGVPKALVEARLARLVSLLELDMQWRLHKVSDGQRRRAQLLLKLLRPSQLLLLDEVTTDLDILSRQALLQFLREESEQRGVTVIYSTHIFDGLDDWPTHVLHLKEGGLVKVGPMQAAVPTQAGTSSSGSLYQTVRGWLDSEREERRTAAIQSISTIPTPCQTDALATPTPAAEPKPAAPARFASKFDRFGGAQRQSMFAR